MVGRLTSVLDPCTFLWGLLGGRLFMGGAGLLAPGHVPCDWACVATAALSLPGLGVGDLGSAGAMASVPGPGGACF